MCRRPATSNFANAFGQRATVATLCDLQPADASTAQLVNIVRWWVEETSPEALAETAYGICRRHVSASSVIEISMSDPVLDIIFNQVDEVLPAKSQGDATHLLGKYGCDTTWCTVHSCPECSSWLYKRKGVPSHALANETSMATLCCSCLESAECLKRFAPMRRNDPGTGRFGTCTKFPPRGTVESLGLSGVLATKSFWQKMRYAVCREVQLGQQRDEVERHE